jgi:hypothetical protein
MQGRLASVGSSSHGFAVERKKPRHKLALAPFRLCSQVQLRDTVTLQARASAGSHDHRGRHRGCAHARQQFCRVCCSRRRLLRLAGFYRGRLQALCMGPHRGLAANSNCVQPSYLLNPCALVGFCLRYSYQPPPSGTLHAHQAALLSRHMPLCDATACIRRGRRPRRASHHLQSCQRRTYTATLCHSMSRVCSAACNCA